MKNAKGIIELQQCSELAMLLRLAWPIIVSLLVQGIYSLVDSLFLSRLGEEVLSAVSLAFVAQSLATGFFNGIAGSMNAIISREIGAGKMNRAKTAVICGLLVQLLIVVFFMMFGTFGVRSFFEKTTTLTNVINYGFDYLKPCMLFIFAAAGQVSFERLLQSTGLNRYMLFAQGIGSLVNIILDPILIFGLLGCPAFGVSGAAYATIIGQFVAFLLAFLFNFTKNGILFDDLFENHIELEVIKEVLKIGLPLAAMGFASSFGNYFINRILLGFSAAANAAFGVYAKLQNVALMPVLGVSNALVTMYAFFYGKKDLNRIRKTLGSGAIVLGTWGTLCFLVLFFFPIPLLNLFNSSEEMKSVGLYCFRIIALTYLCSSPMTVMVAFFQSIGKSIYSLCMSLARQVFVRVPIAFWLASYGNVRILWWCWPISELTSDIVIVVLFTRVFTELSKTLMKKENIDGRDEM